MLPGRKTSKMSGLPAGTGMSVADIRRSRAHSPRCPGPDTRGEEEGCPVPAPERERHRVWGGKQGRSDNPGSLADEHKTLTLAWKPVEIIPRRKPPLSKRPLVLGISIPFCERRTIPEGALLHRSVVLRKQAKGYWPPNMQTDFGVEY